MALTEKRIEAKNLYVLKAMPCSAIAEELGVDAGTVYRWKAEAAEKGEVQDWDFQRELHNTSPSEIAARFNKSIAIMMLKIAEEPELLLSPKQADAMSKFVKAAEKIDPRRQYFNAITHLIKITNQWLAEHQPDLKTKLDPYWDSIFQELSDYATREGLFKGD